MKANLETKGRAGRRGRMGCWAGWLLLAWATTGCSPSTLLARRMMDAPNRVPDFVKPQGRVWLSWAEGVLERFPSGTNQVGEPAVDLRWVRVEPADYGWSRHESAETHRSRVVPMFRFGFQLPANGLPSPRPARGTAYVLHGYGVDLETMFPWAVYLAEAGWRAVLVDLPGHGLSGGRQVTFGVREVACLKELRETLGQSGGWTGPVVVIGHSMGASLALRWQALDEAVVGSVAFGPYSEFAPAVLRLRDDYVPWMPRGWVSRAAGKIPGMLGVEPGRLDTRETIRGSGIQALLVASVNDRVTPPEDSVRLQAELGDRSSLLIVGDATHETLPFAFPQHGERVVAWLDGVGLGTKRPPDGGGLRREAMDFRRVICGRWRRGGSRRARWRSVGAGVRR